MSNHTTNTICPPNNKLNEDKLLSKQVLEVTEKYLFLHKILYNFFWRVPMVSMIYIIVFYPTSFYYHINCFIITYLQEQIIFMISHIALHMNFNYAKPSINDMGLFTFLAYIHHYTNPLILSQLNFYSYCNQYIESTGIKTSIINQHKSFTKNIICLFIPFYFFIPTNYNLLYLLTLTYSLKLSQITLLIIIVNLMKSYNIDNIHISIYIIYKIFHTYLQAITHLWYHTLESNKKQHFGLFLFYVMSFLEKIQIVSSKTHKIHHKHGLHNLKDVEVWYDLYIPSFMNTCADNIFKNIINLNVENDVKIKISLIIKTVMVFTVVISFTYVIIIII
jgi:hypothetical protein